MLNYVINLDRTPERYQLFRQNNAHFRDIIRYSAIDGAKLNRQNLIDQRIITSDLKYSSGALGCALSHRNLWRMASRTREPTTIVEDDAILHSSFFYLREHLLSKLQKNWDIVVWGWNFDCPIMYDMIPDISYCYSTFREDFIGLNWKKYQSQPIQPNTYKMRFCFGTPCYSVSRQGAQKLLDMVAPLSDFKFSITGVFTASNKGIDVALIKAYGLIDAFICVPPLALTPNDKKVSTVNQDDNG